MKKVVCAGLCLVSLQAWAAEPCIDNFTVKGNVLIGKTYKSWASVPNVSRDDAFQRAYAFTVANGFTVTSSSKEAGAISAAQTVSYGQGKTVPLNIVLQQESGAVRVDLHYATSGGMFAPEDAIKQHFCKTIAAVGVAGASASPPSASAATVAPSAGRKGGIGQGYAMASDAQHEGYRKELTKNVANPKLRPLIEEAAPAIAEYVERVACLNDYTGASALNAYAAPGVDLQNRYVVMRPMREMQYHTKASCLTASRVQGWKAPANNALQFEVVYKTDDSGEVKKLVHEMVRQPDGAWLFTQ